MTRATRQLARILFGIAMAATAVMAVLTVGDVLLRYALRSPIPGTYELVGFLSVMAVSLALPQIQAKHGHIVVDLVARKAKPALANALELAILAIQAAFFGVLTWRVAVNAGDIFAAGQVSDILHIPLVFMYSIAAVGPAGTTLVLLEQCADWVARRRA